MNKNTSLFLLLSVVALTGCEREIYQYEQTWEHRAHALQRELDADQSILRTTFLGTHNSYNASAYTTATAYLDPNHVHSIGNQLRMDIRALELDVHSFVGYNEETKVFEDSLKLCHGTGAHLGCSPWDRNLISGLQEVADWIEAPENSDEILLIYIEDHISDDDYGAAIDDLENTLGDYLYRPTASGCDYIDATITKNDIRSAGKNILLLSDGCNDTAFNELVFGGFEGGPGGYPTASVSNLLESNECIDNKFSEDEVMGLFVRMQEDRTTLSNLVGVAGPKVTPEVIDMMVHCEINLVGTDKLRPFDGRLTAAIWSWDTDQPVESDDAQCAMHNSNDRFESADCVTSAQYACRDDSGDWFITEANGNWDSGEAACQAASGVFTVPFSGLDNRKLAQAKTDSNVEAVWLGYQKPQNSQWLAF